MKKKLLALLLTAAMLLSLCACGVSSSSSSNVTITTSTTDENGNTTTKTSTAEAGITVGTDGIHTTASTSTTTSDGSELPDYDEWAGQFDYGAYGENKEGEAFWFAYNDDDPITYAALLIVSDGGSIYYYREGEVVPEGEGDDEHLVLIDAVKDVGVPFAFYGSETADFEMYFLVDGDRVDMTIEEDEVSFLQEFYGNVQQIREFEEENSAAAKTGGNSAGVRAGKKSASRSRELEDIRATWASIYNEGAEGINDTGEIFVLAVNDFSDIQKASFMMISADGKSLELYVVGTVVLEEDGPVLYDDYDEGLNLPFGLEETDEGFDMYFQDGDVAHMVFFSQDKILDDMLMIVAAGR